MTQQLIALAKSAIAAKEFVSAIEHLEEALVENPEDATIIELLSDAKQKRREQLTEHVKSLVSKSQVAVTEKNYDMAISLLESVIALAKDDPYIADLAREQAVKVLLQQAQREKDTDRRLHVARMAFQRGDYDEARHALDFLITSQRPEVTELQQQIQDAWRLWDSARLAMNGKQYVAAREYLQELQERFPQSRLEANEMLHRAEYFLLIEKAERAKQQGMLEEAYDYYRHALRNSSPDDKALVALNELEETLARRQRASELVKRAQYAMNAGDFDEAVYSFRQALEHDQTYREAHSGLNEAMGRAAKQREEKIRELLSISRTAIEQQDPDLARRRLEEADNLTPNPRQEKQIRELFVEIEDLRHHLEKQEPQIRELLSICQEAIEHQDFLAARRYLELAKELNPNHRLVKQLHAKVEDEEQREAKIQELFSKSQAAIEHQNFTQARQFLGEANRLNPKHPEIERLSLVLEERQRQHEFQEQMLLQAQRAIKASKFREAADLYERILSLNPDNISAMEGLQSVDRLLQNAQAEKILTDAREYLSTGDAEQTLRMLKRAEQLSSSPDLEDQIITLTNNANILLGKQAEIQRQLDEVNILLSLNQPDKALDITQELLQSSPTDQAIRSLHQKAFEASARNQLKTEKRRPSPTQYMLATVFVIIFILSLLRILGVW